MKGVFGSLLKVCFLRLLPFALSADDKDALAAIEKRGGMAAGGLWWLFHSSSSNSFNASAILMHVQNNAASVLEQAWREA